MTTKSSAPEAQVAEVVCPDCDRCCCVAPGNCGCETCHGTGRLYWWLMRECHWAKRYPGLHEDDGCPDRCSNGWVLAVDLEGLLRVAVATDIIEIVELMMQDVEVGEYALVWWGQLTEAQRQEALAAAILKASNEND